MVRYFLDKGACLNDPLDKRDLIRYGKSGYRLGRDGRKPLLDAIGGCRVGCEAVAKLMLNRGADPNWYHPNYTPPMAVVNKNQFGLVRMLVEYGADVNDGLPPPIAIAVHNENTEIYNYLRKKGAVINTPESRAWAMAFAKFYGLESMAELLVSEGLDEMDMLQRAPRIEEWRTRYSYLERYQELGEKYDGCCDCFRAGWNGECIRSGVAV